MEQKPCYGCASCEHAVMYKGFHIGCSRGVSLYERHPSNDGGWTCEKYTKKEPTSLKADHKHYDHRVSAMCKWILRILINKNGNGHL